MNSPSAQIVDIIRRQLDGTESPAAIERIVVEFGRANGIDDSSLQAVLEALSPATATATATEADTEQTSPSHTGETRASSIPHLIVDWGNELRIGWHVVPEFHIVCPADYRDTPEVDVQIDSHLDQQTRGPIRLTMEEPGYWTFPMRFSLTQGQEDCRPGQYLVDVSLRFRKVPAGQQRFFRTRIRLNVPPQTDSSEAKTLEIEGDGYSIINLHGRNLRRTLKSFHRVIVRGGDRGVINFQDALGSGELDEQETELQPPAESVRHEYELKVDYEREANCARLTQSAHSFHPADRITLEGPGEQRIHLLSTASLTLGRDRSNDIVTRFFPRNERNDQRSANLSRQHARLTLKPGGLLVEDLNSTLGTALNGVEIPAEQPAVIESPGHAHQLTLGTHESVDQPFHLDLQAFESEQHAEYPIQLDLDLETCEALNTPQPQLWSLSRQSGIAALRLTPSHEQAATETFVVLFHEATSGSSSLDVISTALSASAQRTARILHIGGGFWIQQLSAARNSVLSVNGQPAVQPMELVPLSPGMSLQIADREFRVSEWQQCHL